MTEELTRRRVIVTSPDIVEVITEPYRHSRQAKRCRDVGVGMCGSDKAGVHGEHAFMKPPTTPT